MTMLSPNPFGSDLQSLPDENGILDLDPAMLEGSGRTLLGQSIARRFTTERGSVLDSPNDCLDIRGYLSDGFTQAGINQIPNLLKNEAEKDQRVVNADVQVQYFQQTKELAITMAIQSAYGPFTLTLSITAVTVSLLIGDG